MILYLIIIYKNNFCFSKAPILPPKQQIENTEEGTIPSWRRSGSFRSRIQESEPTNVLPPSKLNDNLQNKFIYYNLFLFY